MLGKRRRELVELQDKGKEYDRLLDELKDIRILVNLNGMPMVNANLMEIILIVRALGEAELIKTHGNAKVDGRIYSGIVEKRRTIAQAGTQPVY